MNKVKEYTKEIFENIKHIDEEGSEYWNARELIEVLEYSLWQNFHKIIKIAMENSSNSNYIVSDHFIDINKMVNIGSKTKRKIQDYRLSRYACYLIVLNCDPKKSLKELEKDYFIY